MRRTLLSLTALSTLAAVVGCATEATDPDLLQKGEQALPIAPPEPAPDPETKPGDPVLTSTVVASGPGWKKLRVKGSARDLDTDAVSAFDQELLLVENGDGAAAAPISKLTRTALVADFAAKKGTDDDTVSIIDPVKDAEAQRLADSGVALFGACSSYDKTLEKSLSTTKTYSYHKGSESGSFTGSADFTATLSASAYGKVVLRVRKSWCVPVGVDLKYAQIRGNANVTAKAKVDATFEKKWSFSKRLAEPTIANVPFSIAGIPLKLVFTAPIDVGVDAAAKATMKLDGALVAKGAFDVNCTKNGCNGSKSATYDWAPNGSPTVSVSARVKVTPWAQAAIKASLYSDALGYGQVGVRGRIDADLWGYTGNDCGDANGDGTAEYVNALTLDLRAGVDITAKAEVLGNEVGSWSWNVLDRHLAFYNLGATTAMTPIVRLVNAPLGSNTVKATARMRPCWPYPDAMTYQVDFGDGTIASTSALAQAGATASHTYGSWGQKTVKVTAVKDAGDRTPGQSTTESIRLSPVVLVDPLPSKLAL